MAAIGKAGTLLLPGFASLEGAVGGGPPAGKTTGIAEFAARSALTNLTMASDQTTARAPHALEMTWPLTAMAEADGTTAQRVMSPPIPGGG